MRRTKKQILINTCYKVLCSYENYQNGKEGFEDYQACLKRAIIALSSQQAVDTILDSLILLNGLMNMGSKVTHDDVKQVIFHATNEIDRNLEEVN